MTNPVEEYRRRVYQKINLEIRPGMKVLDLGCGHGFDSDYFAQKGATVLGIDTISSRHWQQLKKRHPLLTFQVGNAEKLPLSSGSFNLVYAKDVAHHTQNPEKFLKEALRLTKKGGELVIIEANRYNLLFFIHLTLMRGHQHFEKKRFKEMVKKIKGKNKVRFLEFEAHVWPFPYWLRKGCNLCQNWLEKLFFWKPYLSYNGAIIKKGT